MVGFNKFLILTVFFSLSSTALAKDFGRNQVKVVEAEESAAAGISAA